MQFKALKHKTLPDVYAYPINFPVEFSHASLPLPQPITATKEAMAKYYKEQPIALKQLDDYDMVTLTALSAEEAATITNVMEEALVQIKYLHKKLGALTVTGMNILGRLDTAISILKQNNP